MFWEARLMLVWEGQWQVISVPSVTSLWTSCDFGVSVVDDDDLHADSTTLCVCLSVPLLFCLKSPGENLARYRSVLLQQATPSQGV